MSSHCSADSLLVVCRSCTPAHRKAAAAAQDALIRGAQAFGRPSCFCPTSPQQSICCCACASSHIDVDGVSCLGMLPMQDITAPSVSWMLVDMLTWPAKPSSASSTISAHSNSAEEDCRSVQCTLATDTDSAALESPTGQPQHASELQQTTERSSHRSRVSGGPGSAGHQQKLSERIARNGNRRVCKVERRMAGDVHIVRPSALRRSASCPEAAAQPGAGELLLAQHSSRLS